MILCGLSEFLLSCSVKDRRQYYRTSGFVPLDDVPAWTPTTGHSSLLNVKYYLHMKPNGISLDVYHSIRTMNFTLFYDAVMVPTK